MGWIEQKYIGLISGQLLRFKVRGGAYNFRCPICNDSEKDKNKARGYLFTKGTNVVYHCHNCNITLPFGKFLEKVDHRAHEEYVREVFMEAKGFTQAPVASPPPINVITQPKFLSSDSPLKKLKRMSQLNPDHPAKKYIVNRQIPSKYHFKLFYAPKFKAWVNSIIPDKFEDTSTDEPRMVIPFLDRSGDLYGFQGRSFRKDGVRYISIMLDPDKPKMFGLDTVDFTKHVYILEGPIDSMFVPNSLAMAGADMVTAQRLLQLDPSRCTVVFDNEPRNSQIVKRIEAYAAAGYNICLWPSHINHKDVNDMVRGGIKPADIKLIIDNNTFSGLRAQMAISSWKKC